MNRPVYHRKRYYRCNSKVMFQILAKLIGYFYLRNGKNMYQSN